MKEKIINEILESMLPHLNNYQGEILKENLSKILFNYKIEESKFQKTEEKTDLLNLFLSAKRIEGCSEKTLRYYNATITNLIKSTNKEIKKIETEDIRDYLTRYQNNNNLKRVSIDNIRRILSSFFSWLEDENYILKSPARRIRKVKTIYNVKETYSDEELELMRNNFQEPRDKAIKSFSFNRYENW